MKIRNFFLFFRRKISRGTWIGIYLVRRKITAKYLKKPSSQARTWHFQKTESSNFYYALENHNILYLCSLLSVVLEVPQSRIREYITELESDVALREHFKQFLLTRKLKHSRAEYARRVGWYAIVRVLKPKLVVETGVSDGLGSCILSLALSKNLGEGLTGTYIGIDNNPNSGRLYVSPYSTHGQIIFKDSHAALSAISSSIDLFISDSNHDPNYEFREYEIVVEKMSSSGIMIGDNSHVSPALNEISLLHHRKFLFFKEQPRDHWYPGGGIGISFV